jgi:surface-anchored protein
MAADYTSGHADLGIGYEDGEWDLHLHAEGATVDGVFYPDQEFEAGEVRIIVPLSTQVTGAPLTAPFISDFWNVPESLGLTQGDSFYTLFQNLGDTVTTDSPYLGLAGEEIDPSDFVGGVISVALTEFSGPGEFTLWQDGTGIKFDTLDGIGGDDVLVNLPTGAGAHSHFNYSFSLPGAYEVTLTASGTLTGGGGFTSGTGTYTFVVVPEASTLLLFGLGGIVTLGFGLRRKALRG